MSCVSCVSCEGPPARAFSGAFVFQTQLFSLLRLARSRVPGYSSPRPGLAGRLVPSHPHVRHCHCQAVYRQLTRGSGSVSDTRVSLRRLLSNVQAAEQPPEPLQPQCGRSFPF